MPQAAFDPDKYISDITPASGSAPAAQPSAGFDPDKYISDITPAATSSPSLADAAQSGAASLLQAGKGNLDSVTMGLAKPYFSGLRALFGQAEKGLNEGDVHELDWDKLKTAYKADVENEKRLAAERPTANVVGQVIGAFNPAGLANKVFSGVSKVVAPAAEGLADAARASGIISDAATGARGLANGALGYAGNIAKGAAEGALGSGAVTGIENKVLQNTGYQDPNDAPSVAGSMALGGKIGAGLAAAPGAISAAAQGVGWAGKKAMSTFLGPSVEAITARMGPGGGSIKNAKSVEDIKNGVDQVMSGFLDHVDSSKMSLDDAKSALGDVKDQIARANAEANSKFRMNKQDLNDLVNQTSDQLDRSFGAEKEKLAAIKSPIQMSDDVQTALGDLKQKVVDGSNKSYDILGKQKGRADLSGIQDQIENMKDGLFTGEGDNQALLSSDAQKAHAALEGWQTKLGAIADKNETVSYPVLKDVVREIDRDMGRFGNKMNPGEFNGLAETQMYNLRKAIDGNLKDIPEYANHMEGVASDADLLSRASSQFGDAKKTVSQLNQIGGRTAGSNRALLSELGQATGNDFDTPVKNFTDAQSKLSNPDQIKNSLPEAKAARIAEMAKEQAGREGFQDSFVQNQLDKAGLPQKQSQAEANVESAKTGLDQAKDQANQYPSLKPGGSQTAVQSQLRPPDKENFEVRKQLEQLSDVSGKDFMGWINDRRLANQFQGEYRQGSRNVNIGRAIGGGIGGFLHGGIEGVAAGGALGGATGGLVDKYGPKVAGVISDAVRNAKGPQIVDAIQNLNVSPQVKQAALRELSMFSSQSSSAIPKAAGSEMDKDSSTPAQYKVPAKGPDKWASDGYDNLVQHVGSPKSLDRDSLMSDPGQKELLIQASDLKPGSKAMDALLSKIKAKSAEGKK